MKLRKRIRKIIGTLLLLLIVIVVIDLNYQTLLARHKNKTVLEAAVEVDDLQIPDGVELVGLGEGSHGSVEFQEAKKDIFKILVEKYDYRAFALEADFGDCLKANAYIQGEIEGDARTIVNDMSFVIYHTKQMADLLDWMRQYNEGVTEDKRLRFYGFDMQNPSKCMAYVTDYMKTHGIEETEHPTIDFFLDENRTEGMTEEKCNSLVLELEELETALGPDSADFDQICAKKAVENIKPAMEYYEKMKDGTRGFEDFRDECMAENVSWIVELEEQIGNGKVLISAHDGHIAKAPQNPLQNQIMGKLLAERYGERYYSLGTDFFQGSFNSRVMVDLSGKSGNQRKNFFVTTADFMAYQAKYTGEQRYFLDFRNLSEEGEKSEIYQMVHSDLSMGSLGEGFASYYYLIHSAYRIQMPPADLYDGMIFYYKSTPTDPVYKP